MIFLQFCDLETLIKARETTLIRFKLFMIQHERFKCLKIAERK